MAEILSTILAHSVWELVMITVLLVGIVWAAAAAIVWIVSKIKIRKIGDVEMGGDSPVPKPGVSPHAICLHGQDIVQILKKQADMLNAVNEIRHSIVPQQMRFAESKSADSRGVLQKAFLALMDSERAAGRCPSDNFVDTIDYKMYWMCLRIVHEDVREYLRICFRENHLADKSEAEFRNYVANVKKEVIQNASDTLNELYHGTIITRAMIYEENKKVIPILESYIEETFNHARDVAIRALADIRLKQGEFDSYFQKHMGTGGL